MNLDWGPISGIFFGILEALVTGFAAVFGWLQDESGIFNLLGSFFLIIAGIIAIPITLIGGIFEFFGF